MHHKLDPKSAETILGYLNYDMPRGMAATAYHEIDYHLDEMQGVLVDAESDLIIELTREDEKKIKEILKESMQKIIPIVENRMTRLEKEYNDRNGAKPR